MKPSYSGAWTALVTPFDNNSKVNWEELTALIQFQIEQKITGLLSMGSTGESATVTHREHSKITGNVLDYAGGKCSVIAGTGSNNTDEAIFETRLAQEAGTKTCLLVDCYYNKPSSLELRNEYYSVLLENFPELDFIAYAIPGRSVTVILPEDLAILRAQYPNLVGVKDATGDFERMKRTREIVDDDFEIISGDDPNTFEMMTNQSIRSSGVISVISNITPAPIELYTRYILSGDIDGAKRIDEQLKPLFDVVGVTSTEEISLPNGKTAEVTYKFPNPVPVKTMMVGLGMITTLCKRPLGKMSQAGVEKVRSALRIVWENSPEHLDPIEGFFDVDIEKQLSDDGLWNRLGY